MKNIFSIAAALLCLSGLAVFAQKGDLNQDLELVAAGQAELSYTFETVDHEGNMVTVAVDAPNANPIPDRPWDDPEHPLFVLEQDEFEKSPNAVHKASYVVSVYAVGDEEFRANYSNWTSTVNNIIESADNAYWRDYRINWVIDSYWTWTSTGSSASAILGNLASATSGFGNGLVMGFSDDSNFGAGGIAYVYGSNPGLGVSVCLDQGTSSTVYALRHEAGHNYSCSHDFGSTVCMMNYTYAYSVDYFDSSHDSDVNNHKAWFN